MPEENNDEIRIEQVSSPHGGLQRVLFGPEGLRPGWGLICFFLLLWALLGAARSVVSLYQHRFPGGGGPQVAHAISPGSTIVGEALPFAATLLATWVMSRIERRPISSYGLGRTPGGLKQFSVGLLWGLLMLSIVVGLLLALHLLAFDGRLLFGADVLRYGAIWALGFLLVALFEEYLLRGYLQYTLARGVSGIFAAFRHGASPERAEAVGFWIAAVALSFLFGAGHHTNPGESPVGLLAAGFAGLLFCFALWRTGSLWWAVGFHAAWDWAQSFLYGVPDSGMIAKFHFMATHPVGTPLLSGGVTGPEGSVYVLPVMSLIALVIALSLPKARGNARQVQT